MRKFLGGIWANLVARSMNTNKTTHGKSKNFQQGVTPISMDYTSIQLVLNNLVQYENGQACYNFGWFVCFGQVFVLFLFVFALSRKGSHPPAPHLKE
jgi:hypothetical protein